MSSFEDRTRPESEKSAGNATAASKENSPAAEDDRPAGVPAKSRAPLLLIAAAVVTVFVAGWLFGRRSSGNPAQAQGQTTSAATAATASAPPDTASRAEPETTADGAAPNAAKSAAGSPAQPRGARAEPETMPARTGAATTSPSSPGYRVDDLKTPYR